jgi:hypothetical protein
VRWFVNSPLSYRAQNSAAGQTWFNSVPMDFKLFMLRRIARPWLVMFLGVRRISSSGMSLSGNILDTLVP